jgi:hypothetical protein
MTIRNLTLWMLGLVLYGAGCKEEDKGTVKKAFSTQSLFLEYQVWGDEEREYVTVLLQLRQKNNNGKTLKLEPPGFVELDGEVLQPDSSRLSGYFYEALKPLPDFAGRHKITVANENKEQVSEEFEYTPFKLTSHIRERVGKEGLSLALSGLKAEDRVRVILVDTVFSTPDINEMLPVINGRLEISGELLNSVKTGPVTLLLFKEEDRRIHHPAINGGKIAVTYGLKREFDLVD